jgi:hypothetical protein
MYTTTPGTGTTIFFFAMALLNEIRGAVSCCNTPRATIVADVPDRAGASLSGVILRLILRPCLPSEVRQRSFVPNCCIHEYRIAVSAR